MKKSRINTPPNYFDTYIHKIPDISWREALREFGPVLYENAADILLKIGDQVYGENKWTVKQILQHLIDTERIMLYRALCFARREKQALPGFDENEFAYHADARHRSLYQLLDEYKAVRQSGIFLLESMSEEDMLAKGVAGDNEVSPLAIAFIIAGHAVHHMEVIRDRYFPLIKN